MRRREFVRRLLAGVALIAFIVFLFAGPAGGALAALSERLSGALSQSGAKGIVAFLVLAACSVLLSVFSSAPLVPAAVAAWGRGPTAALLLAGWVLGDLGAYAIGRWGGRALLGRVTRLDRIEAWTALLPPRRALLLATIVRMTFPSEIAYLFGLIRFRFGVFLLLTLFAELPTALLLVYASHALTERRWMTFALLALAGLALGLAAWIVRDGLVRGRRRELDPDAARRRGLRRPRPDAPRASLPRPRGA